MCRFIETICIEEGKVLHLDDHNRRMNNTRRAVWGDVPALDLCRRVDGSSFVGRVRCRVVYGREIEEVAYIPYRLRKVESLALMVCDEAEYRYKSVDRSLLDSLYARRGSADDVLIVRHGLLTDTSIANIALWNGTEWHTPARPLLEGTCRRRLLEKGVIVSRDIHVGDLPLYREVCLFNAMIPFGELKVSVPCIQSVSPVSLIPFGNL